MLLRSCLKALAVMATIFTVSPEKTIDASIQVSEIELKDFSE